MTLDKLHKLPVLLCIYLQDEVNNSHFIALKGQNGNKYGMQQSYLLDL